MEVKLQRVFLLITFVFWLTISSCVPNISSQTSVPVPTSTINIETLRADPGYMAGCLELNSDVYRSQVDYEGIYPGQTKDNEVRYLVGEPLQINDLTDTSWEYDEFALILDNSVVTHIFADNDGELLNATLEDMINKYGCPSAIYALDINEHPSGGYSRLLFIYHNIGFDFTVDKIPVELSEKVSATY